MEPLSPASAPPPQHPTDAPPAKQKLPSLKKLRRRIVADLARALASASHRLARAAGHSVFADPHDHRAALALLRALPLILEEIPGPPPRPRPIRGFVSWPLCTICNTGELHNPDRCPKNPANFPRCPVCNDETRHWTTQCPNLKGSDYELTKLMSGQSKTYDTTEGRFSI
jgi:hypothetical protein